MKIKYIKTNLHNGKKSGRQASKNNYTINYTLADKYFANLTFERLENKNTFVSGVTKENIKTIMKVWQGFGYTKESFYKLGITKALSILAQKQ